VAVVIRLAVVALPAVAGVRLPAVHLPVAMVLPVVVRLPVVARRRAVVGVRLPVLVARLPAMALRKARLLVVPAGHLATVLLVVRLLVVRLLATVLPVVLLVAVCLLAMYLQVRHPAVRRRALRAAATVLPVVPVVPAVATVLPARSPLPAAALVAVPPATDHPAARLLVEGHPVGVGHRRAGSFPRFTEHRMRKVADRSAAAPPMPGHRPRRLALVGTR